MNPDAGVYQRHIEPTPNIGARRCSVKAVILGGVMIMFLLRKGFAYYIVVSGIAYFLPWMFVAYCFIYAYQGIDLSVGKLFTVFLMSLLSGLL